MLIDFIALLKESVFGYFCNSSLFFSSFGLFPCGLMLFFSAVFVFLSLCFCSSDLVGVGGIDLIINYLTAILPKSLIFLFY